MQGFLIENRLKGEPGMVQAAPRAAGERVAPMTLVEVAEPASAGERPDTSMSASEYSQAFQQRICRVQILAGRDLVVSQVCVDAPVQ